MSQKHKVRELAMQAMFLWDVQGNADVMLAQQMAAGSGASPDLHPRALEMAGKAWAMREISDQWVERLAPQWPPRRQPGVDRAILRLAVWEITSSDTPSKVVIDEAIELAKEYSTEQSPAFVNGVMDAVLREQQILMATHLTATSPKMMASAAPVESTESDKSASSVDASNIQSSLIESLAGDSETSKLAEPIAAPAGQLPPVIAD